MYIPIEDELSEETMVLMEEGLQVRLGIEVDTIGKLEILITWKLEEDNQLVWFRDMMLPIALMNITAERGMEGTRDDEDEASQFHQ